MSFSETDTYEIPITNHVSGVTEKRKVNGKTLMALAALGLSTKLRNYWAGYGIDPRTGNRVKINEGIKTIKVGEAMANQDAPWYTEAVAVGQQDIEDILSGKAKFSGRASYTPIERAIHKRICELAEQNGRTKPSSINESLEMLAKLEENGDVDGIANRIRAQAEKSMKDAAEMKALFMVTNLD